MLVKHFRKLKPKNKGDSPLITQISTLIFADLCLICAYLLNSLLISRQIGADKEMKISVHQRGVYPRAIEGKSVYISGPFFLFSLGNKKE